MALMPVAMVLPTADSTPVDPAAAENAPTPTAAMPAVKTIAAAITICFQYFFTNLTVFLKIFLDSLSGALMSFLIADITAPLA